MRRRALEVLACPECSGAFATVDPDSESLDEGILRCASGHVATVEHGVPVLVAPGRRASVDAFASLYARVWAKDGWGSSDSQYLLALPYRDLSGKRKAEWSVKARSMDALLPAIEVGQPLRLLDLGCGMGWLAHHLALRGHDVYAMDVAVDDAVGLGAAAVYIRAGPYFERVRGEIEHPPFLPESMDAVICNASLHYASNLDATLESIVHLLRPGGTLAILNSPVYQNPESARRALEDFQAHLRSLGGGDVAPAYHHFLRSVLMESLVRRVGLVHEVTYNPGSSFRWSRRLKGSALRMELASFPIFVATKPKGDAGIAR